MDESLCSKVRLTISAKKLKDLDVFSKSDPICVVYMSPGPLRGKDQFREVGRTETVMNCLNPEWSTKILVDYYFEEVQKIRFEVYDVDSPSRDLACHDFIGSTEATLGEIVGASCSRKTFLLEDKQCGRRGELTVVAEEEDSGSQEKINFLCHALKVDKKDFFGKSDPFLNIYRINDEGMKHLVHRTEVIKNTLNPTWKPFELTVQQLCSGDKHRKLIVECFDYDNDGGHDFIGSCETSLQRLLDGTDVALPLVNEKKRQKKGKRYIDSGRLIFDSVQARRIYSFLEYITGGTQLDFAVAVDMTASNLPPNDSNSLHYIYGGTPNEYQVAIHAVADICQHYNDSKIFDAMGFGAKIPRSNPHIVQHCFPLDLARMSYNVVGVQQLMEAYQSSITNCILYGPTNFAPLIDRVAKRAAAFPRDGSRYQVLLIITDGCICDFEATKEVIVTASALPLSIIIVGVGGSNFDKMDDLDSDNQLLMSKGRRAVRDIVQFVPMRNFLQKSGRAGDYVVSMALLAKEVLEEIPEQLTSYMNMNGIKPRPRTDPFIQSSPSAGFQSPGTTAVGDSSHRISQYQNITPYPPPASQIGFTGPVGPALSDPLRGSFGFSGVSPQQSLPSAYQPMTSPVYLPPAGGTQIPYPSGTPLSAYPQNQVPLYDQGRQLMNGSFPAKNEPPPPYSS